MYYRNPSTDPAFILRIAEKYLIRAKANAHLVMLQERKVVLNAVRERTELTPAITEKFLLAIEQERRLEFAFEPISGLIL
ncbi:RagB/SusD family nutrient uptake outer membrane protein [Pontibacter harenae]|uniref:RagB/SusD family nutrient uptake outer membrane protein n=1 Tax=Pontibacter harenae TaxID=2894083 RepID=UPI001E5F5BD3|nr:RagB/SusD family nutrient uptake outer membrane protein [Pontibacter harenae]MCC9168535.1 RagB/SusD family nutrient uptake outer membrane protein [Pontibacter harenae]